MLALAPRLPSAAVQQPSSRRARALCGDKRRSKPGKAVADAAFFAAQLAEAEARWEAREARWDEE